MTTDGPVYIKLADKPVDKTENLRNLGVIMIDYADDGSIVGVEIIKTCVINIEPPIVNKT